MMLSPIAFGGTYYATRSINIDFGLETAPVDDTGSAQGRSGDELVRMVPRCTIEPLRADAHVNLKRNVTTGPLAAQFGSGVLAGGTLGVLGVVFGNAYASEVSYVDDNGHARSSIAFNAIDPRRRDPAIRSDDPRLADPKPRPRRKDI